MSVNLAIKQQLLDKIESLSEEQISNVLQFINSLPNLTNNSEPEKPENFLPNQETDIDITYKAWQPCDPFDTVEKLTNLLQEDKLKNNEKL